MMMNEMFDEVKIVSTPYRLEVYITVFDTLYYREFPKGTSREVIYETLDNEAPADWTLYALRPK